MIKKIAIGVVSYERGELTRRCIESIRACTPEETYHIYLVDNGSQSSDARAMLDWCRNGSDITVRTLDKNYGPSYARNIILEMIEADFSIVAFFDNDIVCLPGWSNAAWKAVENGADLIQPKLLNADRRTVERGPTKPRENELAANPQYPGIGLPSSDPVVNTPGEAVIVGGTCVMRREVFGRLGGYDTRLHIGEDFDYSYRARNAGFTLRYVPDCSLVHDHGFDIAYDQERGKVEKYLHAHVFFWRRHHKAILSPQYLCWYGWLLFHDEPMYMETCNKWRTAHRRILRRIARANCMSRNPDGWQSLAAADAETERMAARLGV